MNNKLDSKTVDTREKAQDTAMEYVRERDITINLICVKNCPKNDKYIRKLLEVGCSEERIIVAIKEGLENIINPAKILMPYISVSDTDWNSLFENEMSKVYGILENEGVNGYLKLLTNNKKS